MALQSGLPDQRAAFAAAQELEAWTLDLLWSEVLSQSRGSMPIPEETTPHTAQEEESKGIQSSTSSNVHAIVQEGSGRKE
eukprot:266084-Amphidinium_carterae.3